MVFAKTQPRFYTKGMLVLIISFFIVHATPAHAAQKMRIDAATMERGITVMTKKRAFRVGIPANSIKKRKFVRSTVKKVDQEDTPSTDGLTLLSNVYSYSLSHKKGVALKNPLWINIKYHTKSPNGYELRQYNEETGEWDVLEYSRHKRKRRRIRANIQETEAILAVFERQVEVYSGVASWYNWHGAAMNQFEMGDTVEVTNTATGATATTTIVSRGPYHPGRIIDLPREIFEQLGHLGAGLLNVSVQKVAE